MTNQNFLVLLTVWGLAAGAVNALLIIVPQYLCPYGYTNVSQCCIYLLCFALILGRQVTMTKEIDIFIAP